MTKQEIKDLIAAKIAGQGNQVDIGGVLADILNALADAAGNIPKSYKINRIYGEDIEHPITISPDDVSDVQDADFLEFTDAKLYRVDITKSLVDLVSDDYQNGAIMGIWGENLAFTIPDVIFDTGRLCFLIWDAGLDATLLVEKEQ